MMLRKLSMLPRAKRSDATLALIALKNCDGREKIDPKQIIREGFARANRISTFINLFIGQSVSRKTIVNSVFSLLEQKRIFEA